MAVCDLSNTYHNYDRRFAGIGERAVVKEAIQDCSKMAFEKYSSELEEIHASYERNKVS